MNIKKIYVEDLPIDETITINIDPSHNIDVYETLFFPIEDEDTDDIEDFNNNNNNNIIRNKPLKQNINLISKKIELKNEIECPITYEKTKIVRRLLCGHTYSSSAIEKHFETNRSCPICRLTFI